MDNDALVAELRQCAESQGFDLLEEFHTASKTHKDYSGWSLEGWRFSKAHPASHEFVKANVKRRAGHAPIPLPHSIEINASLDAIRKLRRSGREFAASSVELAKVATLLQHAYGHIAPNRRSVPSAGNFYPLEVYLVAINVESISRGVYHYLPVEHALELCSDGIPPEVLPAALADQFYESEASFPPAHIVVTAVFPRTVYKYGLRAYRLALLEAGHVGHAAVLAGTALSLACFPNVAFYDVALDRLLGVDGVTESALYMVSVGEPLD